MTIATSWSLKNLLGERTGSTRSVTDQDVMNVYAPAWRFRSTTHLAVSPTKLRYRTVEPFLCRNLSGGQEV